MIETSSVSLKDIVDFDHLQRLQDCFAAVAQITSVVIDPSGYPLTKPSNLQGFCAIMQQNETCLGKCIETNSALIAENLETHKPSTLICPHSGLFTASVPIFLEDTLLGCWILGQVRIDDPPDDVLDNTAGFGGIDRSLLTDAMDMLPKFTKEQFSAFFDYLMALSQTLTQLTHAGYDMKYKNQKMEELTEELHITGSMLRRFIDSADAAMYVRDAFSGEVLMVNEKLCELVKLPMEDIVYRSCFDVISNGDLSDMTFCTPEYIDTLFDEDSNPNDIKRLDELFLARTNTWMRRTSQGIHWVDGRCALMVTLSDITKEHLEQDKLEELAYYDRNLKLPNLLKLSEDYSEYTDNEMHLICIDIKELRRINDAYGRTIGDALLELIVTWMKGKLWRGQYLYRIDGDAFAVLVPGFDSTVAKDIANQITKRFEESWVLPIGEEDVNIFCGVHVCIISNNVNISNADSLSNVIERAMDTSREEGIVTFYDIDLDKKFKDHLSFQLTLKKSILQGMEHFSLAYQPIICASTKKWCGVEALCRYNHPYYGNVPPTTFIHEVETMGLMEPLGMWILESAISQCKAWKLDTLDGFFIDVNFSPIQFGDPKLLNDVSSLLDKYDFPASALCIEITESMDLFFTPHVKKAIEGLSNHHIRVALDDFGIGYSSFQSLRNVPARVLKTERQFVQNIEHDTYLENLFRIMVELGHLANMRLVAEGVETAEQRDIVCKHGADYIQGYYYSMPLNVEEMEQKLNYFFDQISVED